MKIVSIGGGPAGLFFAILLKQARPDTEIEIFERNRADDTFGWGVVFSAETLRNIEEADRKTFASIRERFAYWDDIETWYRGQCTVSTGHGFCGLSRQKLLSLLQDRCAELGVGMHFEREVDIVAATAEAERAGSKLFDADLVLAADGVNSAVRQHFADQFEPKIDWRQCKFAWFGTDKPLRAFTFVFLETEHGVLNVHAYPFEEGCSTWIVECQEDTWRKFGFDQMDEVESARLCEELFKDSLDGHRLLTNRSLWRTFPTVHNERWRHGNVVLLGDAAHTAHFSIGSGTKLAMEDAIALRDAVVEHDDLETALVQYEDARRLEVLKTQRAAQTSLEWFENSDRYVGQSPLQFTFNLMSRSKRITWDNLALRDPGFVEQVRREFAVRELAAPAVAVETADLTVPVPMFTPFKLRSLQLSNRVVVSPMCQYSAHDGEPSDWHLVHLGSRALGGAGLVLTEMTNVSAEGRITNGCTGLYNDAHTAAWRRIVEFIQRNSDAKIGIQLAHAGRKGSVDHPWRGTEDQPLARGDGAWQTLAPSALSYRPDWPVPKAMDSADLARVRDEFVAAVGRALEAGFDAIELHMAHGYLLSSFLSPLTNQRTDDYGGSLDKRMRYPLEVFEACRAVWPKDRPLWVRISATDWLDPDGMTAADSVEFSRELKARGCDLIDVSSAGNVPESKPIYGRMYQVPFAERIRFEVEMPTMAVGAIQGSDHCNTVLAAGRADLCALARPHLYDPYLTLHAADRYGEAVESAAARWPNQYLAGARRAGGPIDV